jgi:AraC-like DNA-binding protein
MFFEASHSLEENEFILIEPTKLDFSLHIHRCFEFFEQIEGATRVTVDDRVYTVKKGEALLIFPLQAHAFDTVENGKIRLILFSPELVANYYKRNENKLPADSLFTCRLPENLCTDTFFHKKAITYFICGEFEKGRSYTEQGEKKSPQLLTSLLLYADKNFSNSCQLRDAVASIGYDYAYASKYFKRKVGLSFKRYVNNLRIIESRYLLSTTAMNMEEIADACGFSSLRTFDREFRSQIGITPSEYRKKKNANPYVNF